MFVRVFLTAQCWRLAKQKHAASPKTDTNVVVAAVGVQLTAQRYCTTLHLASIIAIETECPLL